MSSSNQVAAAVIILDECGVFGRKRKKKEGVVGEEVVVR
jgi:hypothetical protein